MATEMITVKMDEFFLGEVDPVVKNEGYQNRTEFIRNALREKIEAIKLKRAMMGLAHLKAVLRKRRQKKIMKK